MKTLSLISSLRGIALLALGASLFSSPLSAQRDRSIEAYMLAASIYGDGTFGRATGVAVDVDFGTILDSLEMGGMVHYEGFQQQGPWGFMADYSFMDLGFGGASNRGGVLDAGLRQGIAEAMVAYRQNIDDDAVIDWFAGVRWWDFNIDLLLDPAITPGARNISISEDWVDLVFGGRALIPLNEKWTFMARGDIGGITGADFTAQGALGVQYRFGDKWVLDVQYKGLWVDYESGDITGAVGDFAYDTVTHGPMLGIIYEF